MKLMLRKIKLYFFPEYQIVLSQNESGFVQEQLKMSQVFRHIMEMEDMKNSRLWLDYGILPQNVFKAAVLSNHIIQVENSGLYFISPVFLLACNRYTVISRK